MGITGYRHYVTDINYDGKVYITAQEAEPFGWITPTASVVAVDAEGEEIALTFSLEGITALKNLAARVERAMSKMPDAPEV